MNFDKIVEAKIKEAQEQGEFDDLPGKGKPIDLSEYFETPEELRVAQSVLKNAGIISPEVELLRKIAALKEKFSRLTDESEKSKLKKEIKQKQIEFNLMMERLNHQRVKK